jgi:hypothetical protein
MGVGKVERDMGRVGREECCSRRLKSSQNENFRRKICKYEEHPKFRWSWRTRSCEITGIDKGISGGGKVHNLRTISGGKRVGATLQLGIFDQSRL